MKSSWRQNPLSRSPSPPCPTALPSRRRAGRRSPRPSCMPHGAAQGARRKSAKLGGRHACAISPNSRSGDPVVHVQHGIGRYGGLVNLDLGEGMTEFLLLEYDGGDKLYVPVSQLEVISRYSGAQPEESAAAQAGQRPVGQGARARRQAGARHRRRTARSLRQARCARRPCVRRAAARPGSLRRRFRLRGNARPGGRDHRGRRRTWPPASRWTA